MSFPESFQYFFDALRHESHNRAIRIDLQKRSALGWNIFFQGGRMPKGSTKRCMHVHMSVCFAYVLYISYAGCFAFLSLQVSKKTNPTARSYQPRYWAHLKKFKDEAFAKGFGWRRFCQRACICYLSLVFLFSWFCVFVGCFFPLRPSLSLQVKSVFKLPQDTYAGKRSVQEAGMFLPLQQPCRQRKLKTLEDQEISP